VGRALLWWGVVACFVGFFFNLLMGGLFWVFFGRVLNDFVGGGGGVGFLWSLCFFN